MALGEFPDLLAVNAELGLTLQGLNECIAASGEAFTSLLDFAFYSAGITVTYDFSTTIYTRLNSATRQDYWRLVDILPAGSNRDGASIKVDIFYTVQDSGPGPNTAFFYYGIGSNSTTQPTWILVDSSPGIGTVSITVADGEYLFVRAYARIDGGAVDDLAEINLTLQDGSVILPATGTASR